MDFPITKLANIEDADTVVTKIEAGDGVIKVTTKTKGVPSEENIEAGKVKSVNGQTGDVIVDLPVGFMYFSVELTVPTGRLPAFGALYNRALYADLWAYAQERGLVISEAEWQAIASANNGNCAYYSSGDGSSTFRVPKLPNTITADIADELAVKGNGMSVGFEGYAGATGGLFNEGADGRLRLRKEAYGLDVSTGYNGGYDLNTSRIIGITTDPTKSGIVAKTSATKITGQWLIVAFGVAHNIGEADVANVMHAVEQVQTSVQVVDNKITGISDYIIESYRNGKEWYEVYKSGKVRQGGHLKHTNTVVVTTVSFLKPFADTNYTIYGSLNSTDTSSGVVTYRGASILAEDFPPQSTTSFQMVTHQLTGKYWVAEGQGA